MYQLKGRVGRSSRQAYAYFMFPEQVPLTEEASARLMAIGEHSDLGSGMRIAMKDLEIRGAGSLLGAEQSGNMSAVGFDLYASMIAEAVQAAREGRQDAGDILPESLSDITVNVPEHAYLPQEYLLDTDERVLWYRRIAAVDSQAAANELRTSCIERHGALPQAAANCFTKAEIRALANELGVRIVSVVAGKLNLEPLFKPQGQIMEALKASRARYVAPSKKLQIPLKYFSLAEDGSLLEAVRDLLEALLGQRRAS